jgi:hypothetical protein
MVVVVVLAGAGVMGRGSVANSQRGCHGRNAVWTQAKSEIWLEKNLFSLLLARFLLGIARPAGSTTASVHRTGFLVIFLSREEKNKCTIFLVSTRCSSAGMHSGTHRVAHARVLPEKPTLKAEFWGKIWTFTEKSTVSYRRAGCSDARDCALRCHGECRQVQRHHFR